MQDTNGKIPAVFDTDIGCDIDDTWALIYFLKLGCFSPLLITHERGNANYRLSIIGKMLTAMGQTDIELGYGASVLIEDLHLMPQQCWLGDYRLQDYPGKIHLDGVTALISQIMRAEDEVAVITIGPLTNVARALEREPRIADRMHLYSMMGSIYEGLKENSPPYPETNIVKDIPAAQYVLAHQAKMTITPIDSTKRIAVRGTNYQKFRTVQKPEIIQLMAAYQVWTQDPMIMKRGPTFYEQASTNLYDVLSVYLASQERAIDDICEMEAITISIDHTGMTRLDPNGYRVLCASRWKDLDFFMEHFVAVMLR